MNKDDKKIIVDFLNVCQEQDNFNDIFVCNFDGNTYIKNCYGVVYRLDKDNIVRSFIELESWKKTNKCLIKETFKNYYIKRLAEGIPAIDIISEIISMFWLRAIYYIPHNSSYRTIKMEHRIGNAEETGDISPVGIPIISRDENENISILKLIDNTDVFVYGYKAHGIMGWMLKTDAVNIHNNWVMRSYAGELHKCDSCGKLYFTYEYNTIKYFNERTPTPPVEMCPTCITQKYFLCYVCNRFKPKSEEYTTEKMDTGICINHWTYKPVKRYTYNPKFKHIDDKQIYFGIELEVEGRGEMYNDCIHLLNYKDIYLKSDSSIYCGFEIVTTPLDNIYEDWIRKMLSWLRQHGYRSWNTTTCGMHVHVSSSPLSEDTIKWLTEFFHSDKNADFIYTFSERSLDSLRKWATLDGDLKNGASFMDIARIKKSNGIYNHERHSVLNLSRKDTIEFRLFRGTLKYESFLANIEFVKALIDSAESGVSPDFNDVKNYISSSSYDYLKLKLERLKNMKKIY